ncbi:hypothetical protein QBC33DRAFT_551927 [Phialemonium atrogriseum]|uniref:CFEM domain-containing protein n=1 Tax=Phialemonium atrogriseum TaxID=1093897 RepID=A0AAJ0FGL0_9PEZI|nr:uncharacterized protein QBC33DRAFT_551927 [Phialemonium atrogriseum]KAK1762463.1 hypothetical protein QBC33DRAFT_551927 [Phialemonium atrogriseum]
MSIDSLPECFKKCLADAAASIGCAGTDTTCLCTKDLSGSDGSQLMTCVLGTCPLDVIASASSDIVNICGQDPGNASSSGTTMTTTSSPASGGASSSSSSRTTPGTSTNSPSHTSSPSSSGTSTAVAPGGSDPRGGSAGLSTGAKAGIGVGVAVAAILFILSAFLFWRMRRMKKKAASETASAYVPAPTPGSPAEDGIPELSAKPEMGPELGGQPISELESNPRVDGTNDLLGMQGMGYPGSGQPPVHMTTNFPYEAVELDSTPTSRGGGTNV